MALAVVFVDSLSSGAPEARAGADAHEVAVHPGDELIVEFGLPGEELPALSEGLEGVDYHIVREGETLRGIARQRFGDPDMDVELAALNGLADPNRIRAGQRLLLR